MSDQVLYLLMTGASAVMDRMAATTNNLANANTTAFKAQQPVFQAIPYYGESMADQVGVQARNDSANFSNGAIVETGRKLDVAVNGSGWIAVQGGDGQPAYTRSGSLVISADGVLETNDGHPVLGQSATPITLPPLQSLTIGDDGTVSGVPMGGNPNQLVAFDRIMLANPPAKSLKRRPDGLFADTTGAIRIDGTVRLQSGALEQSNVDQVGMMVNLIESTRVFQMETNLMHSAATLGSGSASPLSLQ
jgi:flagellar basal-body rod protein FlgF